MWPPFVEWFSYGSRKTVEETVDDNEASEFMAEMEAKADDDDYYEGNGSYQNVQPQELGEVTLRTCTGKITSIKDAILIIDDKYVVNREGSRQSLTLGQKVQYFLLLDGDVAKVTKVTAYEADSWSAADDEDNPETVSRETAGFTQVVHFKVHNKIGGTLYLTTDNRETCEVNMDEVSLNFIPKRGDRVTCEIITELDKSRPNLLGDTVSVKQIKPNRVRIFSGEVTLWRASQTAGIIDNEVYFDLSACSTGYVPHVGDQVQAQAIESEQGALVWRAVDVQPINFEGSTRRGDPIKSPKKDPLYTPKNGVSVSLLTRKLNVHHNTSLDLQVEVKNSGSEMHTVNNYSVRTRGNKSQISIVNGPRLPLKLGADEKFIFSLVAKACFLGRSSESLVLSFDNDKFFIGCEIELEVEHDSVTAMRTNATVRPQERRNNRFDGRCIIPDENSLICPGVKPIKPPAFIPVQSSQYLVPRIFFKAVLDDNERPRRFREAEEELQRLCPVFAEPLCKQNYVDKFHVLLHLEELNIILRMGRYFQERAVFERRGEYYVLEVPNLMESRPSLIIGDKVYAKNPDVSKTEFEGFVHKTSQNEVWLKFGAAFDGVASDNTFAARFVHTRSVYVRCHQAVDTFCRRGHLGVNWLFPSSVGEAKPPQVIIRDEDEDEVEDNKPSVTELLLEPTESSSDKSSSSRADKLIKTLDPDQISELNSSPNSNRNGLSLNGSANGNDPDTDKSEYSTKDSSEAKIDSGAKPSSMVAAYHHYDYAARHKREEEKIVFVCSGRGYGRSKQKEPEIKACQVLEYDRIKWFNPALNNLQKKAVKNILKGECRPLPYIIHGPPGTGKTVTMVETILQVYTLIPDSRLLIAAPSNSAADLITERILSNLNLYPGELVRLISFSYLTDGRLPAHLRPYSAIADLKEQQDKDEPSCINGVKYCTRDALGHHRITIGTCSSHGVLYTLGFPAGHFTHVFVDEAGQATEPEVLIPLAFLNEKNGQAILAGDPMQLGPVVTSELAKAQLDKSLLYRLISRFPYVRDTERFPTTGGHDPRLITKLLDNYRSIPELLYFTSVNFYDDELIPHVPARNSREELILKKLAPDLPLSNENEGRAASMIFHGVRGDNLQEKESPSWYNPQELIQVYFYLQKIYEAGFSENSVGIITPYQQQAAKIRLLINSQRLPLPKVGSVEEFQGQERQIVIISVVRSREDLSDVDVQHALGFLKNPFRVNVATSRARALMIIIGNPHLIGHDCYWRNVIEYAAKIGGYTGCSYPEFLSFPRYRVGSQLESGDNSDDVN